ncbi:MAG: potassium channel family protein [Candidatus Eisenbacteria bacterium]|nr:potassium channel family protein [Candidatus Eisenbacteria bacterium]
MIAFLLTLARFLRGIWRGLKDPEFRGLFALTGVLMLTGTLFYRAVEGWSALDSLYFSVTTLTTVGYGDLAPSTPAAKVFTIVYLLVGVGVLVVFVGRLASYVLEARSGDWEKLSRRRAARKTDAGE